MHFDGTAQSSLRTESCHPFVSGENLTNLFWFGAFLSSKSLSLFSIRFRPSVSELIISSARRFVREQEAQDRSKIAAKICKACYVKIFTGEGRIQASKILAGPVRVAEMLCSAVLSLG